MVIGRVISLEVENILRLLRVLRNGFYVHQNVRNKSTVYGE